MLSNESEQDETSSQILFKLGKHINSDTSYSNG